MIRFLVAAAALVLSVGVHAAVIDPFRDYVDLHDTVLDAGGASSTTDYDSDGVRFVRTLSVLQTESAYGGDPELAEAMASRLSMGEDFLGLWSEGETSAIFEIAYELEHLFANFLGSEFAGHVEFGVHPRTGETGQGYVTVEAFLNDALLEKMDVSAPTQFSLYLGGGDDLAGRQTLRLVFSGPRDFGAKLEAIHGYISVPSGLPVPEPGALGLFTIAAAVVAATRRPRGRSHT